MNVPLLLLLLQIGGSVVVSSVYDGDSWSEWSDWSPCSRTCDGGVTQQFRRCKSPNGCHGVSIRRKMCNMQPCIEYRDYRGDQCRAFNGIYYKGEKRTWEPLEDPDNPCALTCRAQGTELLAKLSPKLRDGTRCKTGALHVCVDGRCEAVGCDLKLGSPKKIDACGVCGGDSKSCSSPVYKWELHPTAPCSVVCGSGQQPVKVLCRNSLSTEKVDQLFCNSATKPHQNSQSCNIQPCEPQWETGDWSVCSTSCGGGLRIRKVFCAQEKNGTKIQVADKLCHHIRKPSNQEPCNQDPCPHWHAGPWSSCSMSCGKGYKTRNVVCRDAGNLPSSLCDGRLRPSENKACEESSCAVIGGTFAPTAIVFNPRPTKKRRVKTTPLEVEEREPQSTTSKRTTTTIKTTTTTEEEKPEEEDIPTSYPYPTDVDAQVDNDIYIEEELPREHTLPLIQPYPPMDNAVLFDHNAIPSEPTKVRVYFACGWLFLSFVAEEWGACSASCGEGSRTREVKCKIFLEFSRTIANLPDKECPGPKPTEHEPCFSSPCNSIEGESERLSDSHHAALADSDTTGSNMRKTLSVGLPPGISIQDMTFSWKVLGYSPCSASCLGGIQEAMIQCVRDYDQRIATPVLCMDKPQPDIATTRTCNDHPCPPRWNVSEFGSCSKPCGGGVMTREVSCIHEVTRGNTVIVPQSICPSPVPRTEMLCNAVNCPPYWEPAEWSRCSKNCGGGLRTRTLHCKQVSALGQVVELGNGDHHCTSMKPAETKSCNKKPCSKGSRPGSTSSGVGGYEGEPEFKDKVSLAVKGRGTVYAGVSLKLRCPSGKGMDRGALTWLKGHQYLNVQPQRMELIHKTGVLKIKNTTFSDSGIYTCLYNGRPVSNITLMIKPYTGDHHNKKESKRPRGRSSLHESTLYADQQEGGVSVPMSDGQIITPNSKMINSESAASSAASSSPRAFFHSFLSFSSLFVWVGWSGKMDWNWKEDLSKLYSSSSKDSEKVEGEVGKWLRALETSNFPNENLLEEELQEDLSDCGTSETSESVRCPPRWAVGEWSYCDPNECFNWNTALKRRQVSCEFANGTTAGQSLCEQAEANAIIIDMKGKPQGEQECYNPLCLGIWHTHSWSHCKARCGAVGFKSRVLQCVWYGSGRPGGHACHSLPRPKVKKACRGPPCKPIPTTTQSTRTTKRTSESKRRDRKSKSMMTDYWDLYDYENYDDQT